MSPASVTPLHDAATAHAVSPPATPKEILSRGGHIAPPRGPEAGLDVDLIVRDSQAGVDHWQTFATSRHDLLRASRAMEMLDGMQAPQGERLALVLPPSHAAAGPMQVLMDALDDEGHPTADDSVAVASLVDYFNPTKKSRWNRLMRDCKAAFEAAPITDDNWLPRLGCLIDAPSTAVEGWADVIARHVGAKASLRAEALTCNAEQMRLLLSSRALPLEEGERLDWANAYAQHHKEPGETAGDYLTRTRLNASIRWAALPVPRLHTAWQDHALSEAQFTHLLGALTAAEAGYTLTAQPFGRADGPLPTAATAQVSLSVTENRRERVFTGELLLPNFPATYKGHSLQGPVFQAAGSSWRVDLRPEGVQFNALSAPPFVGRLTAGVYHHGFERWFDSNPSEQVFQSADAPAYLRSVRSQPTYYVGWNQLLNNLALVHLFAGSSPWLDESRSLRVRAGLKY